MADSSLSVLRQVVSAVEAQPGKPILKETAALPGEVVPKTSTITTSPSETTQPQSADPRAEAAKVAGHAGHLKILVENAPIAMAMFDGQMRYLLANRRWMEDFKLQNQEIIGRSQYEVFPALHPGWRHVYERALQGQVVRSDRDSVTRDGQRIVYRWEVRPWRNVDTVISGVMITCERLTGTPSTPTAETSTESPPSSQPDAFWKSTLPLLTLDEEGRVLKASTGAVDIFLSSGLQEGKTPLWQIFGEMQSSGPLQNQVLDAVRLVLRQPGTQVPLTFPFQAHAPENAPLYWHLSVVNGSEWGATGRAVLAIGVPAVPPSESEDENQATKEQQAAQALAAETQAKAMAEELARLRISMKEAGDNELVARHREARLRSVLDVLPVGMLVLDERGRPIYHNAQLASLLGRPVLEGQTVESWLALCCRDERHTDEVIRQWREGVWRKQSTRTIALASAEGLVKDIELSPAQLEPGGFVVVFRDVTDIRRLDEMLRSTEAKLRTLILECPVPIILSDRAGGVFDANPAAEDLLDYSRAELRRMPMDLWLKADSFAARSSMLREMARRGDRSAQVDVEVQGAGGRRMPATMKLATVPDASGAPLFTIHYLELHRAPAPAADTIVPPASDEGTAVPAAPVSQPLLTTDANGRVNGWNPAAAQLFGYTEEEATGKGLHAFFRPSDASGFYYELQQLAADPARPAVEWAFFPKGQPRGKDTFTVEPFPAEGPHSVQLWLGVLEGPQFSEIATPLTEPEVEAATEPEGVSALVSAPELEAQPPAPEIPLSESVTAVASPDAPVFQPAPAAVMQPLTAEVFTPSPALPAPAEAESFEALPAEAPAEEMAPEAQAELSEPEAEYDPEVALYKPESFLLDEEEETFDEAPLSLEKSEPESPAHEGPAAVEETPAVDSEVQPQPPAASERALPKPASAELRRERLLIGETHHRVKNHLQIITSMLNLQISTLQHADARDALRSSQNRVRSIAALHQHLYQLASGETANFTEFTSGLVDHLRECYDANPDRVKIDLRLSDAEIPEEWLMPLALSLNEMISNALKHAFPNGRSGHLGVYLSWNDERGELAVEDDGIGLAEDFDGLQTNGLGLKILRVFAGQLGGEVVVNRDPGQGAKFTLRFPLQPIPPVN